VELLVQDPQVDSKRLYFSGHSNGAVMSQRFALQTDTVVAGVVAVSGAAMPNDDQWQGSVSILDYNPTPIVFVAGTIDNVVPFASRRRALPGAIPALNGWAALNGCDGNAVLTDLGDYSCHIFTSCNNSSEVILFEVEGAGHHPFTRGEEPFLLSPKDVIADCPFRGFPFFYEQDCMLQDSDTISLAWDFVSRFQLPG